MSTIVEPAETQPNTQSPAQSVPYFQRKSTRWGLLAVLLLGAGIYVWEEILEDRYVARNWGVVQPDLIFRSGQVSHWLIEGKLIENQIKTVIDMNGLEPENPLKRYQETEMEACDRLGIEHMRFPLKGDGTGDIRNYAGAIAALHASAEQGKPVLIHCAAGAQRTGGAVAYFRVLVEGKSAEFAFDEIHRYESRARKNRTLIQFVNDNMEGVAKLLVEKGVIADVPSPLPQLKVP